jgi:hypothetical protein
MKYTPENIRYCLLSFDHFQDKFTRQFTEKKPSISGLFQWTNAFGGAMDYPRTPEDFEKYNVIHVNITPRNLMLIADLKPKLPKHCKLVFNVDYSVDLWLNNFPNPGLFLQELDKADCIFGVEPIQAETLEMLLHRPVHLIPHPSDIEGIGQLQTNERKSMIGTMIHRYDKNYLLNAYALRHSLNQSEWKTCVFGGSYEPTDVAHLYDIQHAHLAFPELMKITSQLYAVIDTYTIHSYGRYTVEAAILGVPCIGPSCVSAQKRLFPETTIPSNDFPLLSYMIRKLTTDEDFYASVVEKCQNEIDYYSYDNCRNLFLNMLNN